jgi:hypothetical protein
MVAGETTLGVPVIAQVCGSRTRPAGSDGETLHCVIAPPLLLTVSGMISVPSAKTTDASHSVSPADAMDAVLLLAPPWRPQPASLPAKAGPSHIV